MLLKRGYRPRKYNPAAVDFATCGKDNQQQRPIQKTRGKNKLNKYLRRIL